MAEREFDRTWVGDTEVTWTTEGDVVRTLSGTTVSVSPTETYGVGKFGNKYPVTVADGETIGKREGESVNVSEATWVLESVESTVDVGFSDGLAVSDVTMEGVSVSVPEETDEAERVTD